MKPSPLSAVLADDLLLDRVGARLDTDDDLGVLLLAVAHQADTPIPAAVPTRRRRSHRGLTVLAALGVAVSGATVAAAVELSPMPADAASGAPHTRAFVPPSLQALVMPFLAGTPFQGRLVLPFGSLPTVPFVTTAAVAAAPPGSEVPNEGLALPAASATAFADAERGNQEQQDLSRQKTQAKGTQAGGQGNQAGAGTTEQGDAGEAAEQPQGTQTPKPPKSTPTPNPTPTQTGQANGAANGNANGATNGNANGAANGSGATNGQANGAGNGNGAANGNGNGKGNTTGDAPVSGGPDKHGATVGTPNGSTGTPPGQAKKAGATATPTPTSTEPAGTAGTVAPTDGTVTP